MQQENLDQKSYVTTKNLLFCQTARRHIPYRSQNLKSRSRRFSTPQGLLALETIQNPIRLVKPNLSWSSSQRCVVEGRYSSTHSQTFCTKWKWWGSPFCVVLETRTSCTQSFHLKPEDQKTNLHWLKKFQFTQPSCFWASFFNFFL